MTDPIDLAALAEGFAGSKFGELILYHVKRQSLEQVAVSNLATAQGIPLPMEDVADWIDEVNPRGYLESFWSQDCALAFRSLLAEASDFIKQRGHQPLPDEDLFNMFQVLVMNFTHMAHQQPSAKKYIQKCCGVGFFGRLFS